MKPSLAYVHRARGEAARRYRVKMGKDEMEREGRETKGKRKEEGRRERKRSTIFFDFQNGDFNL